MRNLFITAILFFGVGALAQSKNIEYDIRLLKELVNQPSESMDIEGVTKVQFRLKAELEDMGFQVELRENPLKGSDGVSPLSGPLLIGERKVKGQKFITLIGHADTVFQSVNGQVPVPFEFVDEGRKIRGSGVGDDKGGLVVGLRAFRELIKRGPLKYSLRILVSPNEEVGSPGTRDSLATFGEDSVAVFGIEPSFKGNLLKGRGGVHWYKATVKGVESHAGMAHEQGVNACLDLALKLAKISEFTDYDNNMTVNVGVIQGGARGNIVCGEASAIIDTRFSTREQDAFLEGMFHKILLEPLVFSHDGQHVPTQTNVETLVVTKPFQPSDKNIPTIERIIHFVKQTEGRDIVAGYSKGGADISYIVNPNIVMLDALGPYVEGSHTHAEFIETHTLETRSLMLLDVLSHVE